MNLQSLQDHDITGAAAPVFFRTSRTPWPIYLPDTVPDPLPDGHFPPPSNTLHTRADRSLRHNRVDV